MRFAHQLLQSALAAEIRVDGVIIKGIVFMVGVGKEDRRQINAADAQLLQIRQPVGDTAQVAAVEVVVAGIGKVAPLAEPAVVDKARAAAEAVGHDLVPDRVAHPRGRRDDVGGIEPRKFEVLGGNAAALRLGADFVFKHADALSLLLRNKVVLQALEGGAYLRRPERLPLKLAVPAHGNGLALPLAAAVQLVNKRILADKGDSLHAAVCPKVEHHGTFVQGIAVAAR